MGHGTREQQGELRPAATRAMKCGCSPGGFACLVVALCLAPPSAPPAGAAAHAYDDPLAPMLRRMDDYLQVFEVDGVTMDWRYSVIPSEEIRQTVVCQLLAYVELSRLDPRARLRVEILHHADFLLGRLQEIRSFAPFD